MSGSRRPEYLGEPTLAQVMRRPQWILALIGALLVAAAFGWLGQWQWNNAIRVEAQQVVDTETPRPLASVASPGAGVTDEAAGVVVQLRGALVPGDTRIVEPRQNGGETGAWVVAHLVTEDASGVPQGELGAAIGWAPDAAAAQQALERLETDPGFAEPRDFEGRLMPSEAPVVPKPDQDPQSLQSMVPAQLVNVWAEHPAPSYGGYLVTHATADGEDLIRTGGLDVIDSVAPLPAESVNWLNVFYAAEWIVFAGFAVFLWYRLARDAWEKEHELKLLVAAEADEAPSSPDR